jgi:two-component system sensor kinase FixL
MPLLPRLERLISPALAAQVALLALLLADLSRRRRRLAGEALERERAHERFRLALAALPTAVLLADQAGAIAFANTKAHALFGYAEEELLGRTLESLLAASGRNGARRARRRDGSEFLAEVAVTPIGSSRGALRLAAIVDMTEHYELQRTRQELAHASRVSAMGELAGSLAHELNQPLTAILSNAQAAQRFMASGAADSLGELREILADVVRETNRAGEVIRRMRALVRKGELEVAPAGMEGLVREVAGLVHSDAIVRGVRLSLEIEPGLPQVRCDKVQLQQVMLNLLLNAFDALKDRPHHERVVAVQVARDGSAGVQVAVRDTGAGMTSDTLDRIFKPFYSTKREGMGLGLSISRSIIEAHGGRLSAQSNAGKGATFHFTLPA